MEHMHQALLDDEVEAVILDIYAAAMTKHLWNHTTLRISQVLDYTSTYGIAFSGDALGVLHCFRSYIYNNPTYITQLVEKHTEL